MKSLNPRHYLFSLSVDCPYEPGGRCQERCPAEELKIRFLDGASRLDYIENVLTDDEVRDIICGHFERVKEFEPQNAAELDRFCQMLIAQL